MPNRAPTAVAGVVGRSAVASGVMKEDGETFEEPPEVAAASAAASASASGTENREVTLIFLLFVLLVEA